MNFRASLYRNRLLAAIGLLSIALIAYQVAIIQLLSNVQWYHFANVVISVALLGFGAAGALLALLRNWLLKYSYTLLPVLMILSGLMMIGAVELSHSRFARFDSYLLFTGSGQWLKLLLNSLFYFIPFLLGALALGIIFIKYVREIGSFYFSNLLGSGIGAVVAALLGGYFLPSSLPCVMALMAVIAGAILLQGRKQLILIVLVLPVAIYIIYRITSPVPIALSQYKSLSRTLNLPGSEIIIQKPGAYGLVQVVAADALRYAPGLSLAFNSEVPVRKAVFNNGDWYGPLDSWNREDSFHLLDYTTMAAPYVLKDRSKVLVLNAGSGLHVSQALSQGAMEIDATEPHRGVYKLLLNELAVMNDSLWYRPQVKMHLVEPRTFLASANKKYDLIQLPLIGAFGGGVGLYAMREEYILTREAFMEMWNLLDEDGVISVSTWMDYPFRNSLKVTATLAETLDDCGIADPLSHLTAIRSWGTITFILKKTPFTSADTSLLRRFCNAYLFDPLWLPGLHVAERTVHNGISDSTFFAYADVLVAGNREQLYREYGFHIRPATDDKPYFSQFLRWKSLPQLESIFGAQTVSFLELGWLIAAISLVQVSVLAILLIILPLFKLGWRGHYKIWTLLYFSGLGAGYMLLEIVLIQKFLLVFGNPVYAAAFVISVMMLASGIGSYYSERVTPVRNNMQQILFMIVLLLLLYTFFLSPLISLVSGATMFLKLVACIPIIAIPALLMGMPFPLGLRMLSGINENNLPWAWGVNGCVSVISAAFAALLSVEAGFSMVILLSFLFYGVSMGSMYLIKK